jgi:hypothetical protein
MNSVKFGVCSSLLVLGLWATSAVAQSQYYRYINEDGVKVMGHSIPPQYVKNGYEIVATNGRVIEVVEPAPDPEFVEQEREKAELKAEYDLLARRYSTVRDIEAAKQRKLVHVDASIVLVDNSIESIQEEIDDITARAAGFERAGKAVPKNILDTLSALTEKMVATRAIRTQRVEEKSIIEDRFSKELQLFTKGVASFSNENNQDPSVDSPEPPAEDLANKATDSATD